MEQFRQIGEAVGSMKALMVFQDDIQINQRQCSLLLDMFSFAYESIAEEMRQNLKFEEKQTKWKVLEHPLRELHRIFKEGEQYIRQSLEIKDWWAKAISLYQNTDCVEFHIHNLLSCIPTVIEAIECVGEMSGWDHDEIQKKRVIYSMKYRKDCKDPKLFQWRFAKQYAVPQDFCNRVAVVWEEDKWVLLNKIREKRNSGLTKHEKKLCDILIKNLDGSGPLNGKLLPSSVLVGSRDYQVKRRLGSGSQYKEIQWLGESFALRHFFGEMEPFMEAISNELSLSHPNIMHMLCGFTDDEKKECFLVMELMSKDLSSYVREISGPKKRFPFNLAVAVDLMLQIARGMEYLHSKKIYHGDLNPSNILVKARSASTEGYLHAKVAGFGPSSSVKIAQKANSNQNGALPFIWHAPEILAEEEQLGSIGNSRFSEKSDVYSFGMICFELLTGKVPFEDSHLQGDKMSRNIRTGERPLFPFSSPRYLTNLTKKCWHSDPSQRPSFSSICRILRYIKRFLVMNPEHSQPDVLIPAGDYCDIEASLLRNFPSWGNSELLSISQIPFQMFAYQVVEKEKTNPNHKDIYESSSDGASACGDESVIADEPFQSPLPSPRGRKPIASPETPAKRLPSSKKSPDMRANKVPGTPKGRTARPPQLFNCARRMNSESQLLASTPRPRRFSGHSSDSEL
ncbi:uncharacterized protein LOC127802473 [Diospyros lotus]|uniref:uncharacterized protein LOC127802473 n=1 Tax=Diospyros lotus TaxID=55363 RepID=UPI0022546F18|nr:uncharacterized protein LOC127802473 [Diospyros lotus]